MSQRLCIEIVKQGEVQATAFWSWAGYTKPALKLTQLISESKDEIQEKDPVLGAIRLLELTGAGMSSEEKGRIQSLYDVSQFKDATDLDRGLISISREGVEHDQAVNEALVTIDLDTSRVIFDVCMYSDLEDLDPQEASEVETYPMYELDLGSFYMEDIDHIIEFVNDLIEDGTYGYRLSENEVIELVI